MNLWHIETQAMRDVKEYGALPPLSSDDRYFIARMYYMLQSAVGTVLRPKKGQAKFHPNVPWSHNYFMRLMRAAKVVLDNIDVKKPLFLDVGCGLGTTLLLSHKEGFVPYGLDRNKKYLEIAKEMIQDLPIDSISKRIDHLFHVNALEFTRYGEFDCLYWYTPIRDPKLMTQLELKIIREAKMPCVLAVAFYNGLIESQPQIHSLPWETDAGRLYLKCTDEQWETLTERLQFPLLA